MSDCGDPGRSRSLRRRPASQEQRFIRSKRAIPLRCSCTRVLVRALSLRLEASLADARFRSVASSPWPGKDIVHAAMGELEARHLRKLGLVVRLDEPYQHYQF